MVPPIQPLFPQEYLIPGLPHREEFINDFYAGKRSPLDRNPNSSPEDMDFLDFESLAKSAPRIPGTNSISALLGSQAPIAEPTTPIPGLNEHASPPDWDMFNFDRLEGTPIPLRLAACVD